MPSSRGQGCSPAARALALLVAGWGAASAHATTTPGFAVERLYPSAPGGGWVVMDALDMRGGIGGALSLSLGYAHDPLVVRSVQGARSLALVSDEALADIGVAVTYDRLRLYANLVSPIAVHGQSGTVDGTAFAAPNLTLGNTPDSFADVRMGLDARIVGDAHDAFRLGLGLQVYLPSGNRTDYVTDGIVRGMGRVLVAGDVGSVAYAAQVGIHLRPLADASIPGGAQGSELLFGAACGAKLAVLSPQAVSVVIGPEVFGATALQAAGSTNGTGVEALLSARVEGSAEDHEQLRLKFGLGAGLDPRFGTPQWRAVFSAEGFDYNALGAR